MPAISILMGVFNSGNENTLQMAVSSLLSQTFPDFEIIICNDGSTDQTSIYLQKLASQDQRIRVIRNKKNMGLAYSLNRCLKEAKGELIARQDADDYSLPDRLQQERLFLKEHPKIALVGSAIIRFDENGPYDIFHYPPNPQKKDLLFASPFNHGSIMIRKHVIESLGGYTVNPYTRRCEDYDLFMRFYANGYRAHNLESPLYAFCENLDTRKRRKFRYRIDEMIVRYQGFRSLGFGIEKWPYVLKPVAVGIIPWCLLKRLKRRYYKEKITSAF